MAAPIRILMLEDSAIDARLNERVLEQAGMEFEALRVETRDDYERALSDFAPHVIIADYHLPTFDGMQALSLTRDSAPDLPFIFVSGRMGEERAVESLRQGAHDYILKDRVQRLPDAVRRSIRDASFSASLRKARIELETSEARFRSLVESTSDWIVELDAEGRFSYVSPRSIALTGRSPEYFEGRAFVDTVAEPQQSRVRRRFANRVVDDATSDLLEVDVEHANGSSVSFEVSGAPISDPDGEIAGYRLILRDVTERRRLQRIREIESARALTLLGFPRRAATSDEDGFLQAAIDAVRTLTSSRTATLYRVTDTTRSADRVWTSRTSEPADGARAPVVEAVLPDESIAGAIEHARPILCNDPGHCQLEPSLLDCSPGADRAAVVPVIEDDHVRMIATISGKDEAYTDVDVESVTLVIGDAWRHIQRNKAEREVRRYRDHLVELVDERTHQYEEQKNRADAERLRAEAASRAKTSFLANMSHEIRTPLNSILGTVHLLKRDVHDAEDQERLRQVEAAGQHLASVISDLLDIAKIESGRLDLFDGAFDLPMLVRQVSDMAAGLVRDKDTHFEVEVGDIPHWVRGDDVRLRQCLLNLVSNAAKFTDSGTVRLLVQPTSSTAAPDRARLSFTVEDTGIGIEPERIAELFQPFEQGGVGISRRYGGTGLGLAITRRIVEAMGGALDVESTPGRGSRFWFRIDLPLAEDIDRRLGSYRGDAESFLRERAPLRVLLVDDDETQRNMGIALLETVDIDPDVARDGREAVEKAMATAYDVVLMDIMMPNMDGVQATRKIRSLPEHDRTPIMAMTANAFADEQARAIEAGMTDFLTKPIEPKMLFHKMASLLAVPERAEAAPANEDAVPAGSPSARPGSARLPDSVYVAGIEPDLALRSLGNDVPRYLDQLRSYSKEHAKTIPSAIAAWQRNAPAVADRHLHALQGASATVGLATVADLCEQLRSRLAYKASTDALGDAAVFPDDLFAATTTAFETAAAWIAAQAIEDQVDPSTGASSRDVKVDENARQAPLQRLRQLLDAFDTQAIDVLDDEEALMRELLGDEFDAVATEVHRFDFASASDRIARLEAAGTNV